MAVTNPLGGYKVVIWLWKNVTDNVNHKISRFHGGYTTAKAPCNRSPVNSRSVRSQVKWKEIQGIAQITDLIDARKKYIFHAFCNRSSLSTHTLEHLVGDNLINVPLTIRNRKYVIKYEYWPMKTGHAKHYFYCFLPLYLELIILLRRTNKINKSSFVKSNNVELLNIAVLRFYLCGVKN